MARVSAFLHHLVLVIQPFAEHFGGPGLAVVAFLDSSFLSLPEVCDALIVLLTTPHPGRWWYYALATTAGSVTGSYVLYALARKGGEGFLRRRLHQRHAEWGMALFRRHGLLAIVVPSLLPPPVPFKLFVIVAGLADMRSWTFIGAVALGRGFRYGVEAWLAQHYGADALAFIRANLTTVSLWAAGALVVASVLLMLWQRRAV